MTVEQHLRLITLRTGESAEEQLAHQQKQAARWDEMQQWADGQFGRFAACAFKKEADMHRSFAAEIAAHLQDHQGGA